LVTAEVQSGEFPRLDVRIDLEGNHMAKKRFEKILEGLVKPEADGLARGIRAVVGFDPCGEIVVAWGPEKAFLNEGG
jgi:hypothetical protein